MRKAYVIGKNASKSLSPIIFNYWFKKYNINGEYGFKEVNDSDFNDIIPIILNVIKTNKKVLIKKTSS